VLFILLAMLLIIAVAVLVVVYVAYPHRGQEMPNAPWVGEALKRTVDAVPTLEGEGGRPGTARDDPQDNSQNDSLGEGDNDDHKERL
jgi:hypothetical protein